MERTCKKCGETKPIEEFAKTNKSENGKYYINYRNYCLLCHNEMNRIRYNKDLESERKRQRERWELNREKLVREKRERRERNRQKYKETDRRWNAANREKRNKQRKKYTEIHPDRVLIQAKKSRIKSSIFITDGYVKKILERNYGLHPRDLTNEIIESYRQQIKVKRLLKQKKNENTKTS